MPADRPIIVVAAVIERDGRFLLTQRLAGSHLPGRWEFPGGKCEAGESHDACLVRELREELDVGAEVGPEILAIEHRYPDKTVRLHFRWCDINGEPVPQMGQAMQWASRDSLATLDFPEADRDLIDLLCAGAISRPGR